MALAPTPLPTLQELGRRFNIEGSLECAAPCGSGHINDTYAATYQCGAHKKRFIHQRINHYVFKDPPALMENICLVTDHLRNKLQATQATHTERRTLTVVRSDRNEPFVMDSDGNYWRTYPFIEGARSYDTVTSTDQAREAARAFGQFQRLLADYAGPRLTEVIPDFHHTPRRFATFLQSIEADRKNRAASITAEIEFILNREAVTRHLLERHDAGEIPERITHNDTKLNNVLMDDQTGEGLCVIDLDTVMPGLWLYDFGDLVRTAANPAQEDERDLDKVHMQMDIFQAIAQGYLPEVTDVLRPAELETLAFSGKLITLEVGIRFLTDHLNGDVYFKTRRPNHNLDRARAQFKLVESIESQEEAMQNVIATLCQSILDAS